MKQTATGIALGTLFLAPAFAFAASIQLTPTTVDVVAGQTFTVTVTATPSGTPLYTASADIQFDPNIVSVSSFSFAPAWIAVTENGYDLIDNTNGSLIKTGGYPDGFNAPTILGTVTFHAKQAGTATIAATGDSVLLDGGSNEQLSGTQGSVAVTVRNAPTTVASTQGTAEVPVPNNAIVPSAAATGTSATSSSNVGQTAAAASAIGTSSQTAAVGALFNGVPSWAWWTLLAIVVLGLLYWGWRSYANRT